MDSETETRPVDAADDQEQARLRNVYEAVARALAAKSCNCPHCGKGIQMALYEELAKESLFRVTLNPGKGDFFNAAKAGKMLTLFAKLMEASAVDLGERANVSLVDVKVEAGSLEFHLLVTNSHVPPQEAR